MNHKLLLVDDDPLSLAATTLLLKGHGYQIDQATSGAEAIEKYKKNYSQYTLVLLDYRLGDMSGAEVAEELIKISQDSFLLIHSGDPSRDAVASSWKSGAVEFIEKGKDIENLLTCVRNWCRKHEQTIRALNLTSDPTESEKQLSKLRLVGRSASMLEVARRVEIYRDKPQNVLILGETGTGKELIARGLHSENRGEFLAINCAAYKGTTDLLEAELFGYEKGAFTGATTDKKGMLAAANGGTVFFDEIHQLSLAAQAKLLRVFQEKKIRRVGGTKELPVDFRLVAAAKPDLPKRCESGDFLPDLYHRLAVLTIEVPKLAERKEDIEPLVIHFTSQYNKLTGENKTFLVRTLKFLENYAWPGNVRELEHVVTQILTDSPVDKIAPEQLNAKFFGEGETESPRTLDEIKKAHDRAEIRHIEEVLTTSKNKFQAAQRLGISPSTLHSIMKRAGLYQADQKEMS